MWITIHRKIFYTISMILVIASIVLIGVFGLKFGIDFTGGSILEFTYSSDVLEKSQVESILSNYDLGEYQLKETGRTGYILKTKTISDDVKNSMESELSVNGNNPLTIDRFNTVGPTLGDELKIKTVVALIVLSLIIIVFIAYTFRGVSTPVSSWKYGFVAIIALVHDIIIAIGFFGLLGHMFGTEINTLFVTALLVILGYSINDTIVILDRVRENLKDKSDSYREKNFTEIVGKSLRETMARSINTSLTTLLALLALYFIGAESTKDFALALIAGVFVGAYSSIFIAAPLLVSFKKGN